MVRVLFSFTNLEGSLSNITSFTLIKGFFDTQWLLLLTDMQALNAHKPKKTVEHNLKLSKEHEKNPEWFLNIVQH